MKRWPSLGLPSSQTGTSVRISAMSCIQGDGRMIPVGKSSQRRRGGNHRKTNQGITLALPVARCTPDDGDACPNPADADPEPDVEFRIKPYATANARTVVAAFGRGHQRAASVCDGRSAR